MTDCVGVDMRKATPAVGYDVKHLKIPRTPLLDQLSAESGRLYTEAMVEHWRRYRRHGVWLSEYAAKRVHNSHRLHCHTADACVEQFFDALKTWRSVRKSDPTARPPRKRRRWNRVRWKNTAIRVKAGHLVLSNGRNVPALKVPWPDGRPVPCQVDLVFQDGYRLVCTYKTEAATLVAGGDVAGVDLGEVHPAVVATAVGVRIYNGRELRSVRRYREKTKASLASRIDRCKPGSRRRKKLAKSKRRQLSKIDRQIKDREHKITTRLVNDLAADGVGTVVIGDLRNIRRFSPKAGSKGSKGRKFNQKLHQAPLGRTRHQIEYKARRRGILPVVMGEAYTSQTCPRCGERCKPSGRAYKCRECKYTFHRDGVGALNIRAKYQVEHGGGSWPADVVRPVVGVMAPPTGVRWHPHLDCGVARDVTLEIAA